MAVRIKPIGLALLLLAVGMPAAADDTPPATTSTQLVAAAWCPVYDNPPTDDDAALSCDMGVGVALTRYKQVAAVAAIGTKTVGIGLAWVVASTPGERPIAVSLGAIAPYDDRGVDVGEWGVAMGVTFGFGSKDN